MTFSARSAIPGTCALILGCLQVMAGCAQEQAGQKCTDLAKLQIANTTIFGRNRHSGGQAIFADESIWAANCDHIASRALPGALKVNHHKGVDGKDYGDKFELRMPVDWQGRLLFMGGGGLDGLLNPALALQGPGCKAPTASLALSLGYAVVSTDGGHQTSGGPPIDGSFGSDPDARADYTYRSTKLVTEVARKIVAEFYGHSIKTLLLHWLLKWRP